MSITVLDGSLEITEEHAGIIYSVGNRTEAILQKIGNWSAIEKLWKQRRAAYLAVEAVLKEYGEQYEEHYHLLKLPADDPELPGLHNTSWLEGYLIRKGIHPIRTERLPHEHTV